MHRDLRQRLTSTAGFRTTGTGSYRRAVTASECPLRWPAERACRVFGKGVGGQGVGGRPTPRGAVREAWAGPGTGRSGAPGLKDVGTAGERDRRPARAREGRCHGQAEGLGGRHYAADEGRWIRMPGLGSTRRVLTNARTNSMAADAIAPVSSTQTHPRVPGHQPCRVDPPVPDRDVWTGRRGQRDSESPTDMRLFSCRD